MSEQTRLICVMCPRGCRLDVDHDGKTVLGVNGGVCKKGQDYARRELSDPRRMVATTVKVSGGIHPLLPVYTRDSFPKPRITELLQALREVQLSAPVQMGQVVLADALGSGVDVIASRDLPAK